MARLLFIALLALPSMAGIGHAQSAPGGYSDSYGSADARANGDPRDALPPPQPSYGDGSQWTPPPPYAREDQVDAGRADDDAHRADRVRTADLNHRAYDRRPTDRPSPALSDTYAHDQATYRDQLAQHDRDMQVYRDDQARYADRIARWRARADACEHGDTYACEGPE